MGLAQHLVQLRRGPGGRIAHLGVHGPGEFISEFLPRHFFGFSAINLSPETIRALNITNIKPTQTGLLITNVTPGLPAAKAGLTPAALIIEPNITHTFLAKDIILAVNGQPMLDFSDWQVYIEEHVSPGQTVKLTLWRSGETVTVDITPIERPQHPS